MPQWFEDNTQYTIPELPAQIGKYPKLSLVRVYQSGKTQPGWGAKDFVENQKKNAFDSDVALNAFHKYSQPFGIVMRALPFICVDIDGKNGGVETARAMNLPRTLAERSKSGNGYHLFYRLPYTNWSDLRGFDEFPDIIGLVPGVDIKGTGIVFHYPNQLWNVLDIELLPPSLAVLIGQVREIKRYARLTREGALNLDEDELVILHDQLREELHARMEVGHRNQKLYALGARMFSSRYPSWDIEVFNRGLELGLEISEVSELIKNIETYG